MKHWFISDLHIKDINERNGNLLLRFLFFLNKNPKENTLYLLGDIFDLWISNGDVFVRHYGQIVDEIQKLSNSGGKIYYFEGNHDLHIDVFWTKKMNIEVIEGVKFFQINDFKVRCEHGDYINPDDTAYLKYRQTLQKPWVEFFAHVLPSCFWKPVGEFLSSKSRKKTAFYAVTQSEKIKTMVQAYAMKVYNSESFDLIVTGHMHVFDDFSFKGQGQKNIRSINLGTWLDQPRTLLIDENKVTIHDIKSVI